ncbi:thiamine-phosphate kinase [Lentibacillus cibarius]|uniref:Thiamine-monophosphate kinase n=1 Tax=Lentibacillus cibarius TaxID=2583219 RepID=A0A5S3QLE8_9BACI|nr:thiamine-phosphate kinase [Lentibacillus cibarius]TMN22578.1 thiamine-phosphate kinase [Lentibacillus cibarius]
MDEFTFIDQIKQSLYKQPALVKGIGDDAAVFRQSAQDIVTAADTLVEDVHFSRALMDAFYIGYRALAANISDIAAMGAAPAFYLVSIVIPDPCSDEELNDIYKGMSYAASDHRMDLIGGDTVSGNELSIAITVIGFVNRKQARLRSAAEPGDVLFVTGTLGDAAAGFHILNSNKFYKDSSYYMDRHRMPQIRSAFAKQLEPLTRVALNDISDGLASEANEIAEASQVSLTIYENQLPVRDSFEQFSEEEQHKWKLYGGEDFELLGAVPESEWEQLKSIAARNSTPLTAIGYANNRENKDHHVWLVDDSHTPKRLLKKGYTHRSR